MSKTVKRTRVAVGFPAIALLEAWANEVSLAFEDTCYLVGSATRTRQFRDVDVRMIVSDARFVDLFGSQGRPHLFNHRYRVLCTALSVWGKQQTGLPIDFQFQSQSDANENYPGKTRIPLVACGHWDKVLTLRDEPHTEENTDGEPQPLPSQ